LGTGVIYQAITYGLGKFLSSTGIRKVIIGISGGIDSAVAACLYTLVLGPENVLLVNMPSIFNSQTTRSLSARLAGNLDCLYTVMPIQDSVDYTAAQLSQTPVVDLKSGREFKIPVTPFVLENIQARDRSARVLAGLAAAFGGAFTCNSNKSELTAGYSTLYGDLAGFLAVLGDLWKHQVYDLALYLNSQVFRKEVIPQEIIDLVPSAELSPTQAVEEGKGDPIVTDHNYQNIFFCCDDRHPADLMAEGQIDHVLRKAVGSGLDPVRAVQMATLHPARHYNLRGLGGIAPGYQADLLVVSDLSSFRIELVFKAGKLAARQGRYLWLQTGKHAESASNTVHLPELQGRLSLEKPAQNAGARVIEVQPEQILTKCLIIPAAEIDASDELARVAVVERHGKNGNIAVGLVKGFGRLKGALASTVAHDSHNLILVGTDTQDMELAARTVAAAGGGLAVVSEGRVLASLALPVAGLMSNEDADTVSRLHEELHRAAQRIGCSLPSPFMTMSFLALPVIPELRITDFGLVDVTKFEIVDLWKQK
jgi:NAD+ synthetase